MRRSRPVIGGHGSVVTSFTPTNILSSVWHDINKLGRRNRALLEGDGLQALSTAVGHSTSGSGGRSNVIRKPVRIRKISHVSLGRVFSSVVPMPMPTSVADVDSSCGRLTPLPFSTSLLPHKPATQRKASHAFSRQDNGASGISCFAQPSGIIFPPRLANCPWWCVHTRSHM